MGLRHMFKSSPNLNLARSMIQGGPISLQIWARKNLHGQTLFHIMIEVWQENVVICNFCNNSANSALFFSQMTKIGKCQKSLKLEKKPFPIQISIKISIPDTHNRIFNIRYFSRKPSFRLMSLCLVGEPRTFIAVFSLLFF